MSVDAKKLRLLAPMLLAAGLCFSSFGELGRDWTQATNEAPWHTRTSHTSVVHNGNLWLLGGYEAANERNDVWYSPDGVNWANATNTAPWWARFGHSSVVHAGKMWVIGGGVGLPGITAMTHRFNDVWYSSDGVNWSEASNSAP